MADTRPLTPDQPIQRDDKETTTHIFPGFSDSNFDDVTPVVVLPQRPKPLRERIPKTSDVLEIVRADFGVQAIIKHFDDLDDENVAWILNEDMWEKVTQQIAALLIKFAAQTPGLSRRCSRITPRLYTNYKTILSTI